MPSPHTADADTTSAGLFQQSQETIRRFIRARFTRDVAALQISNTVQKLLAAVFWVVIIRLLTPQEYGQYVILLAFFGTISLLGNLGLGPGLVTRLAEAAAAQDHDELRRVTAYLLKCSVALACLLTGLTWLVGTSVALWWYHEPLYGDLVKILALSGPLAAFSIVMTAGLQSVSRMNALALLEIVVKATSTLLGVASILAGMGLMGLVIATVISQALGCVLGLVAYKRILCRYHAFAPLRSVVATAMTLPWRTYFRFSALALVDKNVAGLFSQTPIIFLGRFASPEHAAYYDAARKIFSFLAVFHGAVARKLSVTLAEQKARAGVDGARAVFWRITLMWTPLALGLAAGLTLCLPIFRLVLKPEILPSLTLVIVFAVHTGLMAVGVGFASVFLVTDRIGLNIAIKTPINLACLPLGALLVAQWQAVGAAIYILFAYSLGYITYLSLLASSWFWRTSAHSATAVTKRSVMA